MPNLGNQISFVELLDSCQQVRVPQLQRDYAQGRDSAKEIREGFLGALQGALLRPADDPALPLNLDFVYGSMEQISGRTFLPLDGQQRLTTLFLLHWYLAWRDDKIDVFRNLMRNGPRSRFSYAVRPSSTEFFDALVQFASDESPSDVKSVRKMMEDQPWFYLHWRLDPTIQSALTMLDAIHARFVAHAGLFARLLDTELPPITFQLLPLEHFGLSDDLYIKMNARGKPLTDFETFKARFEQRLQELYPTETRQIGEVSFPVHEFFSRRMDTQWTDFFWSHRETGTAIFDSAVMNLFWVVALASISPDDRSPNAPAITYRSGAGSFSEFDRLGLLTRNFADNLICLLEAWSSDIGGLRHQLPNTRHFDEAAFLKRARRTPQNIQYSELVLFAAFSFYLNANESSVDPQHLQEWMRVVSNLVQNSDIERTTDYERSLDGLRKLLPHSRDILLHLACQDLGAIGFSREQVQEESLKAKLILAHIEWRSRIEAAESHGYFRGQIGFLLDFSGTRVQADELSVGEWSDEQHKELQQRFDDYYKKAKLTFNERGLIELPGESHQWERSLLAIGNYLLRNRSNRSFLTSPASNYDSWKRFLRNGHGRSYLKQMWDRIDAEGDLTAQLAKMRDATGLDSWRSAIISHPEAIQYCELNEIRWIDSTAIYLLRRRQMNGAHAELFTYCLLQRIGRPGCVLSSLNASYNFVTGAYEEPHITLRGTFARESVSFEVYYIKGQYRIRVPLPTGQSDSKLLELLQRDGFSQMDSFLCKDVPSAEIEMSLQGIADKLRDASRECDAPQDAV